MNAIEGGENQLFIGLELVLLSNETVSSPVSAGTMYFRPTKIEFLRTALVMGFYYLFSKCIVQEKTNKRNNFYCRLGGCKVSPKKSGN